MVGFMIYLNVLYDYMYVVIRIFLFVENVFFIVEVV